MRGVRSVICLWPGLAPLWHGGVWAGLATALLFSLLLNFTLVVTFLWFETVSPTTRGALWVTSVGTWLVSIVVSTGWLAQQSRPRTTDKTEDLFRQAQCEYLRGNWVAAEIALWKLLGGNTRDVDARLMLVTLYRHTNRLVEARAELEHLERWESAVKWQWEIGRERERLAEATAEANSRTETADPVSTMTEEEISGNSMAQTDPDQMAQPLDPVEGTDRSRQAIAA